MNMDELTAMGGPLAWVLALPGWAFESQIREMSDIVIEW